MLVLEGGLAAAWAVAIFGPPAGRDYAAAVGGITLATVGVAAWTAEWADAWGRAASRALEPAPEDTPARVLNRSGTMAPMAAQQLRRGFQIRVEPGEVVPADAVVISGGGTVDESAMTGESAPVLKAPGDVLTAGTVLQVGELDATVRSDPEDWYPRRLTRAVEDARRPASPTDQTLQLLLGILSGLVLVVALTLAPLAAHYASLAWPAVWIGLALALVPTTAGALLPAIALAARGTVAALRVIPKSGRPLERAGDVDTVVIDKTGTLTEGRRTAIELMPLAGIERSQLAHWAYLSSVQDRTPEGRTVAALAASVLAESTPEIEGRPVPFSARTRLSGVDLPDGRQVRKGAISSIRLLTDTGVAPLEELADQVAWTGSTPMGVMLDGQPLGIVRLDDQVKAGAAEWIAALHDLGLDTILVTGDHPLTASVIGSALGVGRVQAEATPQDKRALVRRLQAEGRVVAMAGDGVNDAPALAQADVGVALAAGGPAMMDSANLLDLDSNPGKVADIVRAGRQLAMTRGSLIAFSVATDLAKYFVVIPGILHSVPGVMASWPLAALGLANPARTVLAALIFNLLTVLLLLPVAARSARYPTGLRRRQLLVWGGAGLLSALVGIAAIAAGLGWAAGAPAA